MADFKIKYESLVSLALDGFIVYEPGGKIIEFNESTCKHLGYTTEEFSQLNLWDLFLEEDLKKRPLRFDLLQKGIPALDYRRIKRKDGDIYHIELNSVCLPDGNIMALATDITEKSRIRKELSLKEHAVESSISGMGITDLTGKIIFANKALCKMWGVSDESLLVGRDVRDMFEGPQIIDNISTVQSRGIEYAECFGKRLDGSLFPVAFSANIVTDDKGKATCLFGSFIDISEQKKSRYLSEQIIDNLPVLFFMYDVERAKLTRWNTRIEELTGFTSQEIRDMQFGDMIAAQDRAETFRNIRDTIEQGRGEMEVSLLTKNGRLLPVYFKGYLIQLGDKKMILGNGIDISERKQAEEDLRRRYEQLQLLARLSEAVSRASQLEDIYTLALNGLMHTILTDRAAVLLFDDNGVMQFKASHGLSDSYKKTTTGHSPWKQDTLNPAALYIQDVNTEQSLQSLHPVLAREGIQSLGFIPLIYMNRLLGKFMVYFNHVHEYTPEETQLLQAIAREVAFAIGEKESQRVLRESEQKYRDVVNNTRDIIFRADVNGKLTFLNPAWYDILGYSEKQSIGNAILDFVFSEDCASCQFKIGQLIKGEEQYCRHKFRLVTSDNRVCWFEVNARMMNGKDEAGTGIIGVLTDISERKKYEQMLEETNIQLRDLSAHLQDIREEERAEMAREIHDELGQQLTVLKIQFSWIQSQLLPEQHSRLAGKFDEIALHLEGAVNTVRELSANLRPLMLDDLGLVATIRWYLEDIERRVGIRTVFNNDDEDISLPKKVRTALFRIIQESVTNVIRHAEASLLEVTLNHREGKLLLEIKDNGRGFDISYVSGKRTLGLLGMKERASLMGGRYHIDSKPGMGTTVSVEVTADSLSAHTI